MTERNPLDNLGSLCLAGYGYVKFCRHHGIDPRKFIDCIEDVCFSGSRTSRSETKGKP